MTNATLLRLWSFVYRPLQSGRQSPVLHHLCRYPPSAGECTAAGTAGAHRAARGGRAHGRITAGHEPVGAGRAVLRYGAHCGAHPGRRVVPKPKVDSAVVRLERRPEPVVSGVCAEAFFRAVCAGFSQPRKQLRNSLAAGMAVPPAKAEAWLTGAGIAPQRRAETLTLQEWCALVEVARDGGGGVGERESG